MNDPFELAHRLAKSLAPFNHLVVAATDQAYLIGRLQGEVKEILFDLDEAIKQRDEARRERDEARREVCESEKYCKEEAKSRGWDCFKETP
jgi:uncharacterized coiled-coil DUF342 family protein